MPNQPFLAGHSGRFADPDGKPVELRVDPLGILRLPSGRLEASDPFVNLGEAAVFSVPPGDYPAYVTVADVSDDLDGSHLREAYLSLRIADGQVARVEPGVPDGQPPPAPDEFYGVGVDAGTVGLADVAAVARWMPPDDTRWYDDVFDTGREDSWFALMDSPQHYRTGQANIVLPNAPNGENIVLCHSGYGDGFYPVAITYDAAGRLLGVHVDLLVVSGNPDPG